MDAYPLVEYLPEEDGFTGPLLRVLRQVRGQSQRDVEEALGLTPTYLSALETETRRGSKTMVGRLLAHYQATELDVLLTLALLGWPQAMRELKAALCD